MKREVEEELGQTEMAINYRARFAYRIDAWDADGENVIEHLAGVEDLQGWTAVAMAVQRSRRSIPLSWSIITRQMGHVVIPRAQP
jgi:hypothetical protein